MSAIQAKEHNKNPKSRKEANYNILSFGKLFNSQGQPDVLPCTKKKYSTHNIMFYGERYTQSTGVYTHSRDPVGFYF